MKILVVGSGGREHALVWKLKQSRKLTRLCCAPGNGGIASLAECVDIKAEDIQGLKGFARQENIDLTVVGPEVPLVAGIADVFQKEGLKIFGPDRFASQLEGSKIFAKEFMSRNNIPTAAFRSFEDVDAAMAYTGEIRFPAVIKADGLAAGKGVSVCTSREEALRSLHKIMGEKVFQDAGNRVVVEECLTGEEASILAVSDGKDYVMLESSQDHKRIFDGDLGPNTGGMGAYSPAPVITGTMAGQIEETVIKPVIAGMEAEGHPFRGVLYAGLMIADSGPRVLEFNVRFGDPETQAVLPRLQCDLVEILESACGGTLKDKTLTWDERACVCVVMSSQGYPGRYGKGRVISGLESIAGVKDIIVFHAGTREEEGRLVTAGGRVLSVAALGADIASAIKNVYNSVEKIQFEGCHYRRDIAQKALARSNRMES